MRQIAERISSFNRAIGQAVAWLTVLMVILTVVIVVLRYRFDLGWIWSQELVTWMHAIVFMLAAAYTLNVDGHVRVDVFYHRMSSRRKAQVNLAGSALLLIPSCIMVLVFSWEYVSTSWSIGEGSREAGGMPWLFLLKSVIPLTALMLIAQGCAQIVFALADLEAERSREQGQ